MESNVLLNETDLKASNCVMPQDLDGLQNKYQRLYEAHLRIQRVNQSLEDKLLRVVDNTETDKAHLKKTVAGLTQQLTTANHTIKRLTKDNERYKRDVSLAVQFLQCKHSTYIPHKFNTLPPDIQSCVQAHLSSKKEPPDSSIKLVKRTNQLEAKSITVPIPTFPPTAMVYSISNREPDDDSHQESDNIVSAAIMAKVLEEREKDRQHCNDTVTTLKHCESCTCRYYNNQGNMTPTKSTSVGTQTLLTIEKLDSRTRVSGDVAEGQQHPIVKVEPNNCKRCDRAINVANSYNASSEESFTHTETSKLDLISFSNTNEYTQGCSSHLTDGKTYAEMEENVKRFLFGEVDLFNVGDEVHNQNALI